MLQIVCQRWQGRPAGARSRGTSAVVTTKKFGRQPLNNMTDALNATRTCTFAVAFAQGSITFWLINHRLLAHKRYRRAIKQ